MDELVKLVSKKAGISPDEAKLAVEAVVGYLKKKLPAPVAGQIDGLLSGGAASGVSQAANALSGMLGKKKG